MKRIEVGMLCRIVFDGLRTRKLLPGEEAHVQKYKGYIGRITRRARINKGEWEMECVVDMSGFPYSIRESMLEPINPDNESSTWEEVQKLTNWNPTRATA